MPLLEKTKAAGEDAKVMTVLSAGVEPAPVDLDDLGLKRPSLDDVFLTLTGHVASPEEEPA